MHGIIIQIALELRSGDSPSYAQTTKSIVATNPGVNGVTCPRSCRGSIRGLLSLFVYTSALRLITELGGGDVQGQGKGWANG